MPRTNLSAALLFKQESRARRRGAGFLALPALLWLVSHASAIGQTVAAIPVNLYSWGVVTQSYTRTYELITSDVSEALPKAHSFPWVLTDKFYAFGTPAVGTIPLNRFFQPKTLDHFYTTDPTEGQNAITTYGYVAEGMCCWISPTSALGTVPLYRIVQRDQHNYAVGDAALQTEMKTADHPKFEGIAGYVWPARGPPPVLTSTPWQPQPPGAVNAVEMVSFRSVDGKRNGVLTTDPAEIYALGVDYKQWERVSGPPVYVFRALVLAPNIFAFHRYTNFFSGDQSFGIMNVVAFPWHDDGVCFYVSLTVGQGFTPLLRMTKGQQVFYLTSQDQFERFSKKGFARDATSDFSLWAAPLTAPLSAPPNNLAPSC